MSNHIQEAIRHVENALSALAKSEEYTVLSTGDIDNMHKLMCMVTQYRDKAVTSYADGTSGQDAARVFVISASRVSQIRKEQRIKQCVS